eukprot:scaffold151671_cov70-Attheya_sp.AAC.2
MRKHCTPPGSTRYLRSPLERLWRGEVVLRALTMGARALFLVQGVGWMGCSNFQNAAVQRPRARLFLSALRSRILNN